MLSALMRALYDERIKSKVGRKCRVLTVIILVGTACLSPMHSLRSVASQLHYAAPESGLEIIGLRVSSRYRPIRYDRLLKCSSSCGWFSQLLPASEFAIRGERTVNSARVY